MKRLDRLAKPFVLEWGYNPIYNSINNGFHRAIHNDRFCDCKHLLYQLKIPAFVFY